MRKDALTRRYVAALSVVALLSICGQAVVQFALSRQQVDSDFVNIAGRQRMLSQRVTQLTMRLAYEVGRPARRALRADLQATLTAWEAAHAALRYGDPVVGTTATPSPAVDRLLGLVARDLSGMSEAAAEVLAFDGKQPRAVRAALDRLLRHEGRFLRRMDAIVFRAAEEAEARVVTLRVVEAALLGLVLLTLLVEGRFVFRPAARAIRDAFDRLTATAQALQRAEAHKTALIAALPDLLIRVDHSGHCLERLTHPDGWPDGVQSICPAPGQPVSAEVHAALQAALEGGEATTDLCLEQSQPARAIELRVVRLPDNDALLLARDVTALRQVERAVLDASEQTRRQVGRELHDGLCQELAGLHMLTRRAAGRALEGQPPPPEQLAGLSDLVEHALSVGRGLTRGLYPVDLDEGGLVQGLRGLVGRAQIAHPAQVTLGVEGDLPPLPQPTALHLYRIAQEAIGNAARHARPDRITVALSHPTGGPLRLVIADDGHGALLPISEGLGLRSMRFRARLINAQLEVNAEPGRGTQVSCTLATASIDAEGPYP